MFVLQDMLVEAVIVTVVLLVVLLSSVAIGPLVMIALSALVAGIEKRAEERTAVVAGIEYAPTLRNYLERQTYRIEAAPAEDPLCADVCSRPRKADDEVPRK